MCIDLMQAIIVYNSNNFKEMLCQGDKIWYLSKISIFEALPPKDLQELDQMAPMNHFNGLPKNTSCAIT